MPDHDSDRLERIEQILLKFQQSVTTDIQLIRGDFQQLRADLAALEARRNTDITDAKKKSAGLRKSFNGSWPG